MAKITTNLAKARRGDTLAALLTNEEFQIVASNFVAAVVLEKPEVIARILQDDRHPHFMRMMEFFAERGFGKVATEIKGEIHHLPVIALPAKEALDDGTFDAENDQENPSRMETSYPYPLLAVPHVPVPQAGLSPDGDGAGEAVQVV